MLLSVEPVRQEYFSCIDSVVATAANYFGRPAALMFLGYMGFSYSPDKKGAYTYADRLSYGVLRYSRYTLEQYYNIKVSWGHPGQYRVLEQVIQRELGYDRPVGTYLDSFYCPWNAAYQKFHIEHFVLIIGQDTDKGHFICLDPYASEDTYFLSVNHLKKGFGKYILFEAQEARDIRACPLPDILKESRYTCQYEPVFERAYKGMRQFALDIGEKLDMDLEAKRWRGDLSNTKLLRQISTFGKNRTKVSVSLTALEELFPNRTLGEIARHTALLRRQWDHVNTLLMKFYFSRDPSLQIILRDKLLSIAQEERRIAWELIQLAEGGS